MCIYKRYKCDSETRRSLLISFAVSARTNRLLTEAAKKAGNTKYQEATRRLQQHLECFVLLSRSSHHPEENNNAHSPLFISFKVNSRANRLLTKATKITGQTISQEAKFRICDHLERFI